MHQASAVLLTASGLSPEWYGRQPSDEVSHEHTGTGRLINAQAVHPQVVRWVLPQRLLHPLCCSGRLEEQLAPLAAFTRRTSQLAFPHSKTNSYSWVYPNQCNEATAAAFEFNYKVMKAHQYRDPRFSGQKWATKSMSLPQESQQCCSMRAFTCSSCPLLMLPASHSMQH